MAASTVVSVQVEEGLYTLAQARENHLFEFFDVQSSDGQWGAVDLNRCPRLFCIFVASSRMKKIFQTKGVGKAVVPSSAPTPKKMLSAWPLVGERYAASVSLIELDDSYEVVGAEVLREDLVPPRDNEDLRRHELAGMVGRPQDLQERLARHFKEGINWDRQKDFIFKGDLAPG